MAGMVLQEGKPVMACWGSEPCRKLCLSARMVTECRSQVPGDETWNTCLCHWHVLLATRIQGLMIQNVL